MEPVTKTRLADLLRVSKSRVSQYIADGLPVLPDGRIDPEAARAWVEARLDPARRRPETGGAGLRADPGYAQSRARRAAAEAETAELDLAQRKGTLVTVVAVEQAAVRVFGRAVAAFSEAWPALAPELARMTDPVAIAERLAAEQRRIMDDINEAFLADARRLSSR